jgi:hypothetical protein
MSSTLVHVGARAANLAESPRFRRVALGLVAVAGPDAFAGLRTARGFRHGGPERWPRVSRLLDELH